jgi:hypothetical protein
MEWLSLLALLACPLMMIFCMKGLFSGNKDKKESSTQSNVSQQEMQQLQIKMAELMEQNHKLMKEIESQKESRSNVVELKDDSVSKRGIS